MTELVISPGRMTARGGVVPRPRPTARYAIAETCSCGASITLAELDREVVEKWRSTHRHPLERIR